MGRGAWVVLGGRIFTVEVDAPFVFGRADAEGIVGIDPDDMGISATAGSVEAGAGLWWVINRSRKRPLLLDTGTGVPQRLAPTYRFAVTQERLVVLVQGARLTHQIRVEVPADSLARELGDAPTSGTLVDHRLSLSDRDKEVLVALLGGYLEQFPRRSARPRTYQQAAELLGPPWTRVTVRKQIERLRERMARHGVYVDGPQANFDLADHLIAAGQLSAADLPRPQ